MATKKEIDQHLKTALKEIGTIAPWFDEEVNEWIFASPLYPVEYGGTSPAEVVENYPKYLREFIAHRLDQRLAAHVEKQTTGHGGKRTGAGRPKGTQKVAPTKTVRLDVGVAEWVKQHEDDIRHLMAGSMVLVPASPPPTRRRKTA